MTHNVWCSHICLITSMTHNVWCSRICLITSMTHNVWSSRICLLTSTSYIVWSSRICSLTSKTHNVRSSLDANRSPNLDGSHELLFAGLLLISKSFGHFSEILNLISNIMFMTWFYNLNVQNKKKAFSPL